MDGFLATDAEHTIPDQWESQILCRMLLKFKIIVITDAPEQLIKDMHMDYAHNLDEAIAMADAYLGKKDSKITVIPAGALFLRFFMLSVISKFYLSSSTEVTVTSSAPSERSPL